MIYAEVYKKGGFWWYSKRATSGPLTISTKHKTKSKALTEANDDFEKNYIHTLHIFKSNGEYESRKVQAK